MNILADSGANIDAIKAGLAALLVFGIVYAILVAWIHKHFDVTYKTAWLVVVGNLVTNLGYVWIVSQSGPMAWDTHAVILSLSYIASGAPMIGGEWLEGAFAGRKDLAAADEEPRSAKQTKRAK